jgi:uncharacterized secreted protein with C-terminal beta-propeller domain
MKRFIVPVILLLALVLVPGLSPWTTTGYVPTKETLLVDGQRVDVDVISAGRTVMIAIEQLADKVGMRLTSEHDQKTWTADWRGTSAVIPVSERYFTIDKTEIDLSIPTTIMKNHLYVPMEFFTKAFGVTVDWDQDARIALIETRTLPVVGSYANLKRIIARSNQNVGFMGGWKFLRSGMSDQATAPEGMGDSNSYSGTNVQVQGVDEADIIKTDGQYLYQLSNQRFIISRVFPAEDMGVISTLRYDDGKFAPVALYVQGDQAVVIGTYYNMEYPPGVRDVKSDADRMMMPYYYPGTVKAIVYDMTDRGNVKVSREVEMEGYYTSSRMIGSSIYFVANKYMGPIYYYAEENVVRDTPLFKDTAKSEAYESVKFEDIHYFPGSVEPNYLMIGGIDLSKPEQKMEVNTYLGSGQNIYASAEHLYVAVSQYEYPVQKSEPDTNTSSIMPQDIMTKTTIYKFALSNGKTEYTAQGEVKGTVLNQFSMDEYDGYFRIATTKGENWWAESNPTENNIYILDSSLRQIGKLEGLAKGERIYSVRFMGERGYMVTFKNIDPLFVIDLAVPSSPKVLGELKIPGFSDYLHPYTDNLLIGFGKETEEVKFTDWNGEVRTAVVDSGMKVAMFDVSNVSKPIEKDKELIGDRGTYSELLYNHKALMFSNEKNLMAFPVTVMRIRPQSEKPDEVPYGEFAFQGAYIYSIDPEKGITYKGRVTHLNEEDLLNAAKYWYDDGKTIERIIYINDTLYTISREMIRAYELDTLNPIKTIKFGK